MEQYTSSAASAEAALQDGAHRDGGQPQSALPGDRGKRPLYRVCLITGIVLVLLVTVCRTAMLGLEYDDATGFFNEGPPLWCLKGLTLLTVLFAAVGLILFRRCDFGNSLPAPSSTETLFSALCGFFLFATVIMQGIYSFCGLSLERYDISGSSILAYFRRLMGLPEVAVSIGQTVQSIAIAAAIPGGIYFLHAAFSEKPKKKTRAVFGLFFLLWAVLCMLVVNFDMSLPMNSPRRLGALTAFLSIMLFALAELRYHLGRGRISLLFCAGNLAMLFGFSDALPTLLYAFAGRYEMGISTIYACAELSISLYALLRLRSFRYPAFETATEEGGEFSETETEETPSEDRGWLLEDRPSLNTASDDGPEDDEDDEDDDDTPLLLIDSVPANASEEEDEAIKDEEEEEKEEKEQTETEQSNAPEGSGAAVQGSEAAVPDNPEEKSPDGTVKHRRRASRIPKTGASS